LIRAGCVSRRRRISKENSAQGEADTHNEIDETTLAALKEPLRTIYMVGINVCSSEVRNPRSWETTSLN